MATVGVVYSEVVPRVARPVAPSAELAAAAAVAIWAVVRVTGVGTVMGVAVDAGNRAAEVAVKAVGADWAAVGIGVVTAVARAAESRRDQSKSARRRSCTQSPSTLVIARTQ